MNTFDPTKPVQTRDGRKARIVCFDVNYTQGETITALITDKDNLKEYHQSHYKDGRLWFDRDSVCDLINIPEAPKWRAWKPEEVPMHATFKVKTTSYHLRRACITVSDQGMAFGIDAGNGGSFIRTFEHVLKEWEHSLDGGKTYLPCGIQS